MPRPPAYRAQLEQVVGEVFPGGSVVRTRRLGGGLGSLMHAVDVDVNGERLRLTLRRFNHPDGGQDAATTRREWQVLLRLRGAGLAVPGPVWLDAEGARFGTPAMLLHRLPGRPVLAPADVDAWAQGLVSALVTIHRLDVRVLGGLLAGETREQRQLRYLDEELTEQVLDASVVDARELVHATRERIVGDEPRMTHGDYHAGNVLWHRGRVSGVIDWSWPRLGDPRFDLAYLRLDTALILGQGAAEAVRRAYTLASRSEVEDLPAWDLLAATTALPDPVEWLPGYLEQGRTDLDEETVRRRYREFVRRATEAG